MLNFTHSVSFWGVFLCTEVHRNNQIYFSIFPSIIILWFNFINQVKISFLCFHHKCEHSLFVDWARVCFWWKQTRKWNSQSVECAEHLHLLILIQLWLLISFCIWNNICFNHVSWASISVACYSYSLFFSHSYHQIFPCQLFQFYSSRFSHLLSLL